MQLIQFDGGLSTRVAPHFLDATQGVKYENVDNAVATLSPVKSSLATAIEVELYSAYYIAGDEWRSSKIPATYLEYQGVMYSTNGIQPTKYSNGSQQNLGITAPSDSPGISVGSQATPPATFKIQNDLTQGDLPNGELAYRLYNRSDEYMSVPVEFVVSETNEAYPDTTDLESLVVLEQVSSTDVFSGTVTGYNPYTPVTFKTATTSNASALRSVTISEILNNLTDDSIGCQLYRYYDDTWYLVHTFDTSADEEYTDDVYDISDNAELDEDQVTPFNGTYQYVYTYYNEDDGSESAPSGLTDELEVYSGKVAVTMVESSDSQVTHNRIYRVGGYRSQFALVDSVAANITEYTDELLDSDMNGDLLSSENYYAPEAGLQFLTESYAMLFGAVDSTVYFTPIGVPDAWPPEYSIDLKAEITGIGAVSNGVLVMTKYQTYIITGTGPTTLAIQLLRGDQGCVSHFSIQSIQEGALVWASTDGLCISSGNDVTNISKSALGTYEADVVNSAVVDEVYYLQLVGGDILAYDYRFTSIFKTLNLGTGSVVAANSQVYGNIDGELYELFKSEEVESFQYLSPRFAGGSLTQSKTYKKVYIHHDGDIIISIIIDDETVTTQTLTGKDSDIIQVPSNKQRGFYIQFEVTGTGVVNEITCAIGTQSDG